MNKFNLFSWFAVLFVLFNACNQASKNTEETVSVTEQTKESVTCRIWKTESFCKVPNNVNVHGAVQYSNTFVRGISCDSLNSQNLVGVWVTFQGKNVDSLNMKSHYENISLIRKNKEILHPIAYMERSKPIMEDGTPQYASNKSTFGSCTFILTPNEKYDLFILFEAAETGDKLIIEDFLEAEIE
jgi:hypothetical protein